MSMDVDTALDKVIRASLRSLSATYLADDHAYSDAEAEYALELVCLAARELVEAVEAQNPEHQPVSWNDKRKD
jgi:hypothetical protein